MQSRMAVADAIKNGDAKLAIDYLKRKHRDEFSEQHNQKVDISDNPSLKAIDESTRAALKKIGMLDETIE